MKVARDWCYTHDAPLPDGFCPACEALGRNQDLLTQEARLTDAILELTKAVKALDRRLVACTMPTGPRIPK